MNTFWGYLVIDLLMVDRASDTSISGLHHGTVSNCIAIEQIPSVNIIKTNAIFAIWADNVKYFKFIIN